MKINSKVEIVFLVSVFFSPERRFLSPNPNQEKNP